MNSIKYYEFGPFRLDLEERTLTRDAQLLSVTNKSLELLLVLLEREGMLVEKDALMRRLWPDQIVEESNLTQHIYSLRKALGEDSNDARYIQTVPRRGYRFTGEVKKIPVALDEPSPAPVPAASAAKSPPPVRNNWLSDTVQRRNALKRLFMPFSVVGGEFIWESNELTQK